MSDLVEGTGLVAKDGKATGEMARWMKQQSREAAALGSGKAAKSQAWEQSWLIEYPENKSYRVVVNAALARTITSVTARSSAGTCTMTVNINATPLGGTANSVTSTESTQTHTSANAVAVGDDIVLTVTSNSSSENVSVTMIGTIALA